MKSFLRSGCLTLFAVTGVGLFYGGVCLAEEIKTQGNAKPPPVRPSYRLKRPTHDIEMQKLLGPGLGLTQSGSQTYPSSVPAPSSNVRTVNDSMPEFSYGPLGPGGPSGPMGPGMFVFKRETTRPECIYIEGMGNFLLTNQVRTTKTPEGIFLVPGTVLIPYKGQVMDRKTGEIFFERKTLRDFKRNNQPIPQPIILTQPMKWKYSNGQSTIQYLNGSN